MVHLGSNIAKLRGFRRLPQKDVAERLKMSQQDYSRLENTSEINDDLLERIASIVDFPVDLIKELDLNTSINNINKDGVNTGNFNNSVFNNNPLDKLNELIEGNKQLIEENKQLYERLLREKEEMLEIYKKNSTSSL